MKDRGLQAAINAMSSERGKMAALARKLKIKTQAISQWKRVPINRVIEVERITKVPREELRPDFFRPEPKSVKSRSE